MLELLHNFSNISERKRKKPTYPGCFLETELELRVRLEAGDEDAVEGDGGGHGDGALSRPAAACLH